MAAITSAGTTWNTTGGNTTVTATPAINDLIIVIAASSGLAGGTTAVTDDNSSGTYTQVDVDRTGFSTTGVLTVWVRNSLITAASSTIFTAAQGSSSGGGLTVLRVSGMTRAGAVAIRGTGGESTGTSATTPAPVLASTPLPGNPVIAAVCCGTNSTTNFTPRTGYTEHNDSGYNTPATGLETMSRASGETSATITWGSTAPSTFASVAIELDTSGSTGKVYTNPQTQAPYAAAGGQAPFQQRQWQPPIPMRIWGTTSPEPPPVPGDLPLVPVVAHAVESIETRPYRFVETLLVDPAAAASSDTPQRPLVIQGPQPFLYLRQSPYAYIARQPGDNPVPARPTIVAGIQPPIERPYGFVERPYDTPVAAPADTPQRPLVVGGIQPPIERPFKFLEFQATDPRADPVGKPVVVRCQELPIWRTTVLVNWTAVQADTPISATVVRGAEPPQPLPYSFVERTVADPPAAAPQVPLAPIAVRAQQPPLPQPFTYIGRPPTEPPAAAPQLPIAPRIVSAQPVPYPVQTPFVWHASVDPTTAPQVPIAAKIIASQPAPPQAAYVFIGRSIPSLVAPVASIVVRSQEPGRPPSFAFIQRPPTGPPPPSLNRPAIPIIVDRNVPPPYGSVRLRKGFAVALPVLGQGSITGGVRTGSAATGGVLERGVIAGGIRTSSASTGGALGAGAMIGLASLPTVLGGGYGVVLYPSDSLLPSDSLFPSEVSVPSGGGGYVAGGVR